jgi:hypothetical protein
VLPDKKVATALSTAEAPGDAPVTGSKQTAWNFFHRKEPGEKLLR